MDRKIGEKIEIEKQEGCCRTDIRITGHTGLYCLIGSPVEHSGSPAMHNYSFARTGVDAVYLAFDVTLDKLPDAVRAIRTLGVRGFNITMPCKTAVMEYLDELSPEAKLIGACNTVTVGRDGKMTGYNTDGIGFLQNLRCHGTDIQGKHMVMLGTGGAATAICAQAALEGARCVTICNYSDHSYRTACQIAKKLQEAAPDTVFRVVPLKDEAAFAREAAEADVLVNGTKAGMKPLDEETLVDSSLFRPELVVADVVYNPRKTRMLREAEAAGCSVVGGIGMLLWQGAAAFERFTGQRMPVEEVQERFFSRSI